MMWTVFWFVVVPIKISLLIFVLTVIYDWMVYRTVNFLGGSHNNYYVVSLKVCRIMSLYSRLLKEKKRLGKFVLRTPRTTQELLNRKRWERVTLILTRRYDEGREEFLDDIRREEHEDALAAMKRQDHFDEIEQVKRF